MYTTEGNAQDCKTMEIEIRSRHWSEFLIVTHGNIVYQQFTFFLAFVTIISTMMYANFAAFRIDAEGHEHSHNKMKYYEKTDNEI